MRQRALIFDCDGTLMDSLGQAVASFHYALDQLGEPRSTPDILRYFGVSADRILLHILKDEARAATAYGIYKKHQTEHAAQTPVFPGIKDLLERAQKIAVPMGIVTGRHRQDLEILLQAHDLLRYFPVIVTDNELKEPKPSPEGLRRALSQLGMDPAEAYYIGDSPSDMLAAHAAGVTAVAALWYAQVERDRVLATRPHHAVEHPDELWPLFQRP